MASVWDERFGNDGYAYGTEPNRWLQARAGSLRPRSHILSLGEGEGRNAVWLAKLGHRVEAVDGSSVGLEKARRLASASGVEIVTTVGDLAAYQPASGAFDAVLLIYLHLPPPLRSLVHARAQAALAPGGIVLLEAFTPRQLAFSSGGPRQVEMLYEPRTLALDFPEVAWSPLREETIELDEGSQHRGPAAVVRGQGRRVGAVMGR